MAAEDPLAYLYPLDTTGTALTNKVANERKTVNPPSEEFDFNFILPGAAPFYRDTMVLINVTTGAELVRGVDWAPGHRFTSASYELQSIKGGVYASILFYNRKFSGQVAMTYQTLGGPWTLYETKILEILSNRAVDPRFVTYEEVSGKPDVFPPIEHNHPADDLTGFRELISANYDIAAAIREKTDSFLTNPPILMSQFYTADEIDAKLESLGLGVSPDDIESLVTSMTDSYTQAADQLESI